MAPRWLEFLTGPSPTGHPHAVPPLKLTRPKQPASASPRYFRDLLAANPQLTESQLLNANNRKPYTAKADVVVGGGGIIGLIYAIHLKTIMPHLDIAVFEKSASPQHKIGESTLSSFTRFLNTDVVHTDYLLRLFGVKDGLDFLWVDEHGSRPIGQDIGHLDVSLQLDRRVSDLFLTMWAQQLGVRVYHGVGVNYQVEIPTDAPPTDSTVREILLKDAGKSLGVLDDQCQPTMDSTIEARYVCDASGFACRLMSQVGQKELFDGWNTDAVWAYVKPLEFQPEEGKDDELIDWDYAAIKHICFAEGWGWFIKLISWHKAPLANLMDMLAHFIDLAIQRTPMNEMPSTTQLSRRFDCPFEFITSIGWSRYELLPGYYHGRTYFQRPIVVGTNWFAVGNATGFTNPLISPGINVGLVGAIKSAEMTMRCLQAAHFADASYAQRIGRETRTEYQQYIHDYVLTRLDMMNRFWYNSFRDGRLFEAAIICYWVAGSGNRAHLSFHLGPGDFEWLVGAGSDAFAAFYREIMLLIAGPCDGKPVGDDTVTQVRAICRRWLDAAVAQHPQPWSSNQRH